MHPPEKHCINAMCEAVILQESNKMNFDFIRHLVYEKDRIAYFGK